MGKITHHELDRACLSKSYFYWIQFLFATLMNPTQTCSHEQNWKSKYRGLLKPARHAPQILNFMDSHTHVSPSSHRWEIWRATVKQRSALQCKISLSSAHPVVPIAGPCGNIRIDQIWNTLGYHINAFINQIGVWEWSYMVCVSVPNFTWTGSLCHPCGPETSTLKLHQCGNNLGLPYSRGQTWRTTVNLLCVFLCQISFEGFYGAKTANFNQIWNFGYPTPFSDQGQICHATVSQWFLFHIKFNFDWCFL